MGVGYNPLQIVPCILLSELITGLSSSFFHHKFKNADFRIGALDLKIALVMA